MKKILLASCFLLALIMTACMNVVQGDGNVVRQPRHEGRFNSIDVSGAFNIYIKQGENSSLEIETDENLMALINSELSDGNLKVWTATAVNPTEMNLYVTAEYLNAIDASGAVDIESVTPLESDDLDIDISGAADLNLEVITGTLNMDISGASEIDLEGQARNMSIELSGAADVDAEDLRTQNCEISISGAGSAIVHADQKLDASISGAGSVVYSGDPQVTKDVSGAGSIRKKN